MSELAKWVKDKNGNKVGFLIAFNPYRLSCHDNSDFVNIGFSFCDTRSDKFNRDEAINLACKRAIYFERAQNKEQIYNKIPFAYRPEMDKFINRCNRYFKCCNFPAWTK